MKRTDHIKRCFDYIVSALHEANTDLLICLPSLAVLGPFSPSLPATKSRKISLFPQTFHSKPYFVLSKDRKVEDRGKGEKFNKSGREGVVL